MIQHYTTNLVKIGLTKLNDDLWNLAGDCPFGRLVCRPLSSLLPPYFCSKSSMSSSAEFTALRLYIDFALIIKDLWTLMALNLML